MESVLDMDRLALGIKQPWAELILQGVKTLEIRTRPTRVRGPIYLYTSQKLATETFATDALNRYRLVADDMTKGMIVGSVNIVDCRPTNPEDALSACLPPELLDDRYAWVLEAPKRLLLPQPVRFLPYGVWFYPYKRRSPKKA